MATTTCKANNPATCRHHGMPLRKLEAKLLKCKTSEEYLHIKHLISEQKIKTYLDSLPKEKLTSQFEQDDLTVQEHGSKQDRFDGSVWANYWVDDANGEAIGFIKLHIHKNDKGEVERVAVCDVEVNPKFKGKGAALAVFRKMKTHFQVTHLETGATFSEKGHAMFLKLRGHELATGEKTLQLDKYSFRNEDAIIGYGSYKFVDDWVARKPSHRL